MKSPTYVEGQVTALIDVSSKTELKKVTVERAKEQTENEKPLYGQQWNDEGISQSEIDALLD